MFILDFVILDKHHPGERLGLSIALFGITDMDTTDLNEKALQNPVDAPAQPDTIKEVEEEEGTLSEGNDASNKGKTRPNCDDCGRSCSNNRMLRYHKATHLNYNERPYGCETCGRRYAYPSHLARHRRQKHGDLQTPSD
jgi:uncharacterized Zn-finger protein